MPSLTNAITLRLLLFAIFATQLRLNISFKMKNNFISANIDFVGFTASLLCAIHCSVLPLLLSMAPLAGLQFLDNHWIEFGVILVSLIIASKALIYGYNKHHHKLLPLAIVLVGFTLIGLGQLLHEEIGEVVLTTSGGVTIALAHYVNWKYIRNTKASCAINYDNNSAT